MSRLFSGPSASSVLNNRHLMPVTEPVEAKFHFLIAKIRLAPAPLFINYFVAFSFSKT